MRARPNARPQKARRQRKAALRPTLPPAALASASARSILAILQTFECARPCLHPQLRRKPSVPVAYLGELPFGALLSPATFRQHIAKPEFFRTRKARHIVLRAPTLRRSFLIRCPALHPGNLHVRHAPSSLERADPDILHAKHRHSIRRRGSRKARCVPVLELPTHASSDSSPY